MLIEIDSKIMTIPKSQRRRHKKTISRSREKNLRDEDTQEKSSGLISPNENQPQQSCVPS